MRAEAVVDLSAIKHNVALLKERAGTNLLAVVKADAYGHGLENGLRGFAAADGLSLIEFDRAVQLRDLGWTKPIMMMQGMFEASDLDLISHYQLQPVLHNAEQLEMLAKASLSKPIHVHLKINTGMNRLGIPFPSAQKLSGNFYGIMSHFAESGLPNHATTVSQKANFYELCENLRAEHYSMSNSGAVQNKILAFCRWCRVEIF
ncbi:MAG: alanine racemase, partial [Actinomycetota bacterium]